MSSTELLRREWTAFRGPGRLIALAAAALSVIAVGLLFAGTTSSSVSDTFWFRHQDLGREGAITVRMTSMTGTITYPPPGHDQIVAGLVPWAKSGIIVKDGLRQGSRYAALAMTGAHGVRFQHDYVHDVAGSASQAPRWLRLTRSGDTITGSESADGEQWHVVGTAELEGLPETVQVGLFATSPGDLTLRETGLGGTIEQVRFTQAVGVFDHVTVEGGAGRWNSGPVGEMNHTDWERFHNASGAVQEDGVVTVSGTGDIGPIGEGGARGVEKALSGLVIALIVVLVVAARYGARETPRRVLAARTVLIGSATFVTGLLAAGIVVATTSPATYVRVVVGVAAVLALCAVLAYGLGVWLRRGWAAILAGVTLVAVPYAVTAVPLLPDAVADWLLRLTPAAGFAVKQTVVEHPQVTAHYAPSAGYFPLPGWAGFAVLCAYTALVLWLASSGSRGSARKPLREPLPGSSG
ncbi:hypothetical protein [Lentzea flaviverrucosa]|uniref:DUF1349 domain-containing protein n=1 Tax=Lentzea flaviverrucosa TaxID=200379 RepID=A0A1H9KPT0_9PSEU|nr:hypothetical protein [Lentzea flaviverrucosa]RDI17941.1 hypothetical protein DFR72_120165 [Lentzea flaviverrucosa]SER00843.1 hypothetical protein SAMN05216195_103664 [Lentzea flaviverrucosa]